MSPCHKPWRNAGEDFEVLLRRNSGSELFFFSSLEVGIFLLLLSLRSELFFFSSGVWARASWQRGSGRLNKASVTKKLPGLVEQAACLGRTNKMASMRSNGGSSRGSSSGTMVFWDMQTAPSPPNFGFLDHLLATHRAMGTGLFSLCPPLKIRAHGTEALATAGHDYIVKNTLLFQQSISCGSDPGSCWKALIVDMLLWATDHPPGMADMVIISRVLDRSLADVIHQLHIRNYNIIVTPSFPPKSMTPLRQSVPHQIKMLHQMFPQSDSLSNGTKVVAVEEEALVASKNDEASIRATNSQQQQNLSHIFRSLLMENCRILVEEYLRKGITEFLESDLYVSFKARFGSKLSHKEVGFEKLDGFLQVAVSGVDFKSILVGTKHWILCKSPGQAIESSLTQKTEKNADNGASQSMPISEARSTTPAQQVLYYGPLTMEEVRNWLEELVASGRANTGINLSLLGKDFEDRTGKKLNYKSLHCPGLMVLLSKFENLVRLERNQSMVHLFPRDMQRQQSSQRARPTVPGNVPLNRQSLRPEVPVVPMRPPYTSLPSIFRVPVPKFSSTALNTTTVRTPTVPTAPLVTVASTAPSTPEVEIVPAADEHASEENHLPISNHLPKADVAGNDQDSLPPKLEKKSAASIRDILAACKPDSSPQISMASKTTLKPPPDLVRDATKVEQHSLPNADNVAVPTSGTEKVHQARNDEDATADAGDGKKFDYYRFTSTVEEREAIKRTFESVNRRLREEFKKRRLAVQPPVAEACDQKNDTP